MSNDLHHLAAAYALDALDLEESEAFERHNSDCDVCVQEVADFREAAAILALGVTQAPSDSLRDRVLAQSAQTRQVSPVVKRAATAKQPTAAQQPSRWRHRFALAAAAVLVVLGIGVLGAERLGESEADQFALVFEAQDAVVTPLEGEQGTLQVIWSADRDQVAVLGSDLPPLEEGQVYELWFLPLTPGSDVVRAGLFGTDGLGGVRHTWGVLDRDSVGWGVTIEPAGGSDQPTSEVLFAGSF